MARCQRYFFQVTTTGVGRFASGGWFTTTDADTIVFFPCKMRTTYTLTYSALADFNFTSHTASKVTTTIALDTSLCLDSADVRVAVGTAGGVAGNYGLLIANSSSSKLNFDCEL